MTEQYVGRLMASAPPRRFTVSVDREILGTTTSLFCRFETKAFDQFLTERGIDATFWDMPELDLIRLVAEFLSSLPPGKPVVPGAAYHVADLYQAKELSW